MNRLSQTNSVIERWHVWYLDYKASLEEITWAYILYVHTSIALASAIGTSETDSAQRGGMRYSHAHVVARVNIASVAEENSS